MPNSTPEKLFWMPEAKQLPDIQHWFYSDSEFNQLYPLPIQLLDKWHWTPLAAAAKAAGFLVTEDHTKILDIGSGVGKFCLGAAYYRPGAYYFGIEQRKNLVQYAEAAREGLQFDNVSFLEGNFTQLDFAKYDHFYFYNSFYENLSGTDKIDNDIAYSMELYHYYNRYLYKQLEQRPAGTRLATFHSLEYEIPTDYHAVGSELDGLLKFWIKM